MTRLLVIDTETGGTNPFVHSILSLAAVVWEDGEVRDVLELLVDEGDELTVDDEAMQINKIDLNVIHREGWPPTEAVARLEKFLDAHFRSLSVVPSKVHVVGHNVGFDVAFMKRLYTHAGADYDATFSHRVLDTASVIAFLSLADKLPLRGAGSSAAFEYFKILVPEGSRHTAGGDAVATALLLTRLLELVNRGPAPNPFGSMTWNNRGIR